MNWKTAYQEFLSTVFWADLREECFERDNRQCVRCPATKRLQAHHVFYPDDWYQTTVHHLITLCRDCHKKEHGLYIPPKEKRRQKKHKRKKPFNHYKAMMRRKSKKQPPRTGNFVLVGGHMIYNPK